MKSSIFAISSILSMAAAMGIADNVQWYTIKTKADVNTLSNLYLSAKSGKVGAYSGTRESASRAAKFFTTEYKPTSTLSIHPGDNTHQISLSGKNGLLNLVDLTNPRGETLDPETPTEWSVFTIGKDGVVGVKDGSALRDRKWVAYLDTDGVYYVGYWDGVTKQPRTVANITLIAEKTTAPK